MAKPLSKTELAALRPRERPDTILKFVMLDDDVGVEARGLFYPFEILALISLGNSRWNDSDSAEEDRQRWCNYRLHRYRKDTKIQIKLDGIFTKRRILYILDKFYNFEGRDGTNG